MLCTKLWNLQTAIAHVDHRLLYALYLIAKDDGIAPWSPCRGIVGTGREVQLQRLELRRMLHLFNAIHEKAISLQLCHGLLGALKVSPRHAVFGSQGDRK